MSVRRVPSGSVASPSGRDFAAPGAPLMARTFGGLLVAASLLALVRLAIPHPGVGHENGVAGVVVLALALGLLLLSGRADRWHRRGFHAVLAGVTLLVTAAGLMAGEGGPGFSLFFLWGTPYAFVFFRLRMAALHVALVGLCSLVVFAVEVEAHEEPAALWQTGRLGLWLLLMGSVVALGVFARQLARSLSAANARFRRGFDASPVPSALVSSDALWLRVNPALASLLGRRPGELVGETCPVLTAIGGQPAPAAEALSAAGAELVEDRMLRAADGSPVWVDATVLPLDDSDGGAIRLVQMMDRTAHRAAEAERAAALHRLAERAAGLEEVAGFARQALTLTELGQVCDAAVDVAAATVRAPLVSIMAFAGTDGGDQPTQRLIAGHGWQQGLVRQRTSEEPTRCTSAEVPMPPFATATGDPVIVGDIISDEWSHLHPLLAEHGVRSAVSLPVGGPVAPFGTLNVFAREPHVFGDGELALLQTVAGVVSAAVERIEMEATAKHAALHDPLTGLPNRTLFADRLPRALDRAQRLGTRVGVLRVDVDSFKAVNESLGHDAGNDVLVALATRLTERLRPSDTIARLSADEFLVLAEDIAKPGDALALADRLAGAWAEPFSVAGTSVYVTASVGLSLSAEQARTDAAALIREADVALYRAKENGRGRIEVFDPVLGARASQRLKLETDLRQAVAEDRLTVAYQPVIDLTTGRCASVEALSRWHHPERGHVSPAEFVAVAEDTGLVLTLGSRVLHRALSDLARWRAELGSAAPDRVTVNVSARQLLQPGFLDDVRSALDVAGVPGASLGIEVTETMLIKDAETAYGVLSGLRGMGVRVFLDDFGTGYSSLVYLKRFPIDVLKIDRAFVSGLGTDQDDTAIVTAVITMAHALGLTVVAEGVETAAHVRRLIDLRCDSGQGFYWARALPGEQLTSQLLAGAPGPRSGDDL